MGRKVLITGRLSAGLLIALALEGLELEQVGGKFTVHEQRMPNGWAGPRFDYQGPPTHGPRRKGKGGKVKRW